ncbi:MAG: hypothetical protein ACOYXC_04100 [Candidatus Rifleibacteriota bacterium]
MRYPKLMFLFLVFVCLVAGCIRPDYGDDIPAATAAATSTVPDLNISENNVITDSTTVANQLNQLLAQLLATKNIRAKHSIRPNSIQYIDIRAQVPQLPNFKDTFISLTPGVSSVLQAFSAGGKLETIPDVNSFMTSFGLTSTTVQLAIREAKAVIVNLSDLTAAEANANPIVTAALREAVPVVFENSHAITDLQNAWKGAASSPAAQRMANAIGIGIESQITVAVPSADSTETDLILLGASGFSQAKNVTQSWEAGNPADPAGEIPEPASEAVSSVAGQVLEDPTGADLRSSHILANQTGIPAAGELPSNQFQSYKLYPWEESQSSIWKPCSNQEFRNYVIYHIQLRYVPALDKKFLRFFTEGRLASLSGFKNDDRSNRGYYQHYHEITMQPVDSNDEYIKPAWLSLYQVSPGSMRIHPMDGTYVATTDLGNGEYTRNSAIGMRGFEIDNFKTYTRGKWKARTFYFARPKEASLPYTWKSEISEEIWRTRLIDYRNTGNFFFSTISTWKDMFVVKSSYPDTILAPPPDARDSIAPQYQVVFTAAGDCQESQRFLLENIQGVRDVWRTAWKGNDDDTFHHDEAYSKKFRRVTIDFSLVKK